ncbi:MAG: hypothetical protein CXZ00_16265 [Acidobacteria bacterium]|nr:MAG: hypothetical protein CXZ00_16265 [Acidobacteriota bacterium]
MGSAILQAALEYERHGLGVIPLRPRDKRPLLASWGEFQDRRATPDEIRAWAEHWPDMNLGLVTGRVSGVVAVDIDGPEGAAWAEANLDKVAIQTTGKDYGFHVFFRQNGVPVKNAVRIAPQVDVRGDGGYVVIAPSIHPNGKQYELHFGPGKTWADLPDWEGITPDEKKQEAEATQTTGTRYGLAALKGEIKKLCAAEPGTQNDTLTKTAFALGRLIGRGHLEHDNVKAALLGAIQAWPNLDLRKSTDTIERSLRDGAKSPKGPDPILDQFNATEDGVAMAFAARHKDSLRFCHDTGAWFRWDGSRWVREKTHLAFDWVRGLCREMPAGAKEAKTLGRASTARGVEAFCRADRAFAVTSEVWDTDLFLLGTPAGTVDLRTGCLVPARPSDYITKSTTVSPAETSDCPIWRRFMDEATEGDNGLQRFLQQIAGYSLTGDVREHALFFVYGTGGNGKSKFLDALTNILGDYATTAAMDTFTASKNDRHPTDLAMLQGARMVCASETEEGRAWAESRIKQLTGGDKITARFMRQDFFTFQPQFKLIIIGNHQPILNNVDDAARRRFNIIPFVHQPANPDNELEVKLRAEYPAILRWMIEGCLDWQANGLVRPESVQTATKAYFDDQDLFGQWLAECCVVERRESDTRVALFDSWEAFADANGEKAGGSKTFTAAMVKRGFSPDRQYVNGKTQRVFLGVTVRHDNPKYWQDQED